MRYYGHWVGEPKGNPEDPTRCVVEVADSGRLVFYHQCRRKRGQGEGGLFCGRHAKQIADGRRLYIPEEVKDV